MALVALLLPSSGLAVVRTFSFLTVIIGGALLVLQCFSFWRDCCCFSVFFFLRGKEKDFQLRPTSCQPRSLVTLVGTKYFPTASAIPMHVVLGPPRRLLTGALVSLSSPFSFIVTPLSVSGQCQLFSKVSLHSSATLLFTFLFKISSRLRNHFFRLLLLVKEPGGDMNRRRRRSIGKK